MSIPLPDQDRETRVQNIMRRRHVLEDRSWTREEAEQQVDAEDQAYAQNLAREEEEARLRAIPGERVKLTVTWVASFDSASWFTTRDELDLAIATRMLVQKGEDGRVVQVIPLAGGVRVQVTSA